ncbi:hypothetical protein AB0J80_02280 [Actinoplanes sp. NPDC049548]|uniref:hypothetical protein n=1 Tax=Actinoplanes sp. NPDC049548 TaxID=3155152 RepID=UPI003449BE27
MTGDAPQPGQTPRTESNPWSWSDPSTGAWWRGKDEPPAANRRTDAATMPAPPTAEAADAHQAGSQDTAAALEPAKPVERPHEQVDAERFNTAGSTTAYVSNAQAARAAEAEQAPAEEVCAAEDATIVDLLAALPAEEPAVAADERRPAEEQSPAAEEESAPAARTGSAEEIQSAAAAVPDVMVLPEPENNRPTVVLDRNAVPGQGPAGRPRLHPARADHARMDRAIQDRVRAERTSALLETSPFWLSEDQRPAPEAPDRPQRTGRPPRRRARDPRRPVSGLLALLVLALVATFFSWVSAEPFWLAVGHGRAGTATVAGCTGSGVTQRCTGEFASADGTYTVRPLALFGVEPDRHAAGSAVPARMVSTDSRQAYVGETSILVHLRWSLGFILVALCGLGIAGLTGVRRLETPRARRAALLFSLAGPLALLAGFLISAY